MKTVFGPLVFLLLFFPATNFGAAASNQGTLEIRIKDHREAIGDFSKLIISIDKLSLNPKVGLKFWQAGWKDLPPSPVSLDLTQYVGKKVATVFRAPVTAGSFDAIHLKLKSVEGVLKEGQRNSQVKNLIGPIRVSLDINVNAETVIVLDLVVLDMSDHPPRGYELNIKGWELYTNGKLVDRIPPG
jgi:hypothetical protein